MEDGIFNDPDSNSHGRTVVALMPDRFLGADCAYFSRKAILLSFNNDDSKGSALISPDSDKGDQRTRAVWIFGSGEAIGRREQILPEGVGVEISQDHWAQTLLLFRFEVRRFALRPLRPVPVGTLTARAHRRFTVEPGNPLVGASLAAVAHQRDWNLRHILKDF